MARKIDDAGEHIEGARKDWKARPLGTSDLGGMTAEEIVESARKDNVWPQPDWEQVVKDGMDVDAAALAKVIRDQMAQEPRERQGIDGADVRRAFVRMTERVRDAVMAGRTSDDVRNAYSRILDEFGGKPSGDRVYEFFSVYKARSCPFFVGHAEATKAAAMLADGFPARRTVKKPAVKRDRERKGRFPEWKRPHLDRLERTGMPFTPDGNVTPEAFIEAFGFRGVQFGNWLPDHERQAVLNMGFEAMMDLAWAMDWEPGQMSLGGTLAVAFGARGKGGRHSAHYEPGKRVMNMTRLSGAGSLAHEFAHAFDHWSGDGTTAPVPGGIPSGSGWEFSKVDRTAILGHRGPESVDAWAAVMRRIYRSPFTKAGRMEMLEGQAAALRDAIARNRSNMEEQERKDPSKRNGLYLRQALDWEKERQKELSLHEQVIIATRALPEDHGFGSRPTSYLREASKIGNGKYWRRPNELFARAFEAWVYDRIVANGGRSDYLVHSVEEPTEGHDGPRAYPEGEERHAIGEAMEALVASMKPHADLLLPSAPSL